MLVGFWLFDFLIVDASITPAWSVVWAGGCCVVSYRIELIVLCVLLIGLFHEGSLTARGCFGGLLFVCVGGLLWASC